MKDDAARIKRLGGPAQLAKLLGYTEPGGTQRVHNWLARGIPASVKVERPDLFLVPLSSQDGTPSAMTAPKRNRKQEA